MGATLEGLPDNMSIDTACCLIKNCTDTCSGCVLFRGDVDTIGELKIKLLNELLGRAT